MQIRFQVCHESGNIVELRCELSAMVMMRLRTGSGIPEPVSSVEEDDVRDVEADIMDEAAEFFLRILRNKFIKLVVAEVVWAVWGNSKRVLS